MFLPPPVPLLSLLFPLFIPDRNICLTSACVCVSCIMYVSCTCQHLTDGCCRHARQADRHAHTHKLVDPSKMVMYSCSYDYVIMCVFVHMRVCLYRVSVCYSKCRWDPWDRPSVFATTYIILIIETNLVTPLGRHTHTLNEDEAIHCTEQLGNSPERPNVGMFWQKWFW